MPTGTAGTRRAAEGNVGVIGRLNARRYGLIVFEWGGSKPGGAMIDMNERVEIAASPWKLAGLGLVGVVMTALSALLAFGFFPSWPASVGVGQFIGYPALVFFGLCTAILMWRALTSRGPVVTITPDGIRDSRVAWEVIPWTAVLHISTWTHSGQKIMVLAVDPAVESQLSLTRIAKMTRGPNRALSVDGLCVTAQGLKMSYDDLLRTSMAYATAAHQRALTYDPA